MGPSIAQAIHEASEVLRQAGVSDAGMDARSLLAHVLGCDRTFLITHGNEPVSTAAEKEFTEFVSRRAAGEPLQYLTGLQAFYNLEFQVTRDVLIPRPETELLVEVALGLLSTLPQGPFVCDVGTGSGCIAISLLHELPHLKALAVDVSPAALRIARTNAARHDVGDRLLLMASDCFAALNARPVFSLIVSNPPYIADRALADLQREVRDHEPLLALMAGPDGLAVVRRLLAQAADYLIDGGHFLFEIGFDQHQAVKDLIQPAVWELLEIHEDLQGIPRTVALRKK